MRNLESPRSTGDNRIASSMDARPPYRLRDWQAGFLFAAALCWPFLLPSLLPEIRWWMLLPLALAAGLLRWQPQRKLSTAAYPLLGFVGVVLLFTLVGEAVYPLNDYGREKVLQFLPLAGIAFLATFRQAPLTETFERGVRASLLVSLALCLLMIVLKRSLFLQYGEVDYGELRAEVSTTGMPLALALAACGLITSKLAPLRMFLSGLALLGIAVIEILVRGRFDAVVMGSVAAMVMLGPPWRNLVPRLALCALLGLAALFAYVNIAPRLGQSYEYFEELRRGEAGGRTPLYHEAWQGFLAHPFGQGIGAFERHNPVPQYPHNILLEVAYEMGVLGLAGMLGIYLLVVRRVWQFWNSPPHRLLGILLLVMFLQPMKAGNIATFAFQWVMIFMLMVATPLSEHWSLAGRRGLR